MGDAGQKRVNQWLKNKLIPNAIASSVLLRYAEVGSVKTASRDIMRDLAKVTSQLIHKASTLDSRKDNFAVQLAVLTWQVSTTKPVSKEISAILQDADALMKQLMGAL